MLYGVKVTAEKARVRSPMSTDGDKCGLEASFFRKLGQSTGVCESMILKGRCTGRMSGRGDWSGAGGGGGDGGQGRDGQTDRQTGRETDRQGKADDDMVRSGD